MTGDIVGGRRACWARDYFETAWLTAPEQPVLRSYNCGDICWDVSGGPELESMLLGALRHLPAAGGRVDFSLRIWSGDPAPPSIQALAKICNGRGEIMPLNVGALRAVYQPGARMLSLLDMETGRGICWCPDLHRIPQYIRSSPCYAAIGWMAPPRRSLLMHAAAVGGAAGGLLIVGASGRGKSTLALSCIGSDLKILSDDYCLVQETAAGEYRVHRLYGAAKLARSQRFRFKNLPPEVVPAGEPDAEKIVYFLDEICPAQLLDRALLSAIVMPKIVEHDAWQIRRIPSARALLGFSASTVFQIPGADEGSLAWLARLAGRTPCFEVEVGAQIDRLPGQLKRVFEML